MSEEDRVCERCGTGNCDQSHVAVTPFTRAQLCEYCYNHLWCNGRLTLKALHSKDGVKQLEFVELNQQGGGPE